MKKDDNYKFNIVDCLTTAVKIGASDIHLRSGMPPFYRINGAMNRLEVSELTERDLGQCIDFIMPTMVKRQASCSFDIDFSFEVKGVSRFRVNLCRQLGKTALVFRVIPYKIKELSELNLPPSLLQIAEYPHGLVLITGPTGCGKTTTIASLIEYINQNFPKHIVTIEDPIEFIYTSKKCLITQRQIGIDTDSFSSGIKYSLRQDPDIILVGEIRDRETMSTALKAAETGHLVLATLHTNDAISTINRVINLFDTESKDFVRMQLANTLRATIAQKLLKRKNSESVIPACEIMVVTPTVQDLIVKNDLDRIYEMVKYGKYNEMLTLNQSLDILVRNNIISKDMALLASNRRNELQQMLKGAYSGTK